MNPLTDPRSLQLDWLDDSREQLDALTWDWKLHTSRGTIGTRLHPAYEKGGAASKMAVLCVGGAGGGLDGPAQGLYPALCCQLQDYGVTGLRLNYRSPNQLEECVLDVLLGVAVLASEGVERVALVGHSFGGAVVVTAGVLSQQVTTVVPLSTQSYGTQIVSQVSPRPMLIVHGDNDTILPDACSRHLYQRALEPKELVIYPGAGHGLDECREPLLELLTRWIGEKLQLPNPVLTQSESIEQVEP